MTRITPHPAFVAHVSARRGALDFAPKLPKLDAAKVWAAVEQRTQPKHNYFIGRLTHDEDAKRARAMIEAARFPEPFETHTIAVAERITNRGGVDDPYVTFVQLLADAHGLDAMVAMKLESVAITMGHQDTKLTFEGPEPAGFDPSWALARALVCRADDASYAKARDVAAKWRAEHPVILRILADYLFADEAAWANADLDEAKPLFATTSNLWHRVQPLLTVTDDATRALSVLDGMNGYAVGSFCGMFVCDLTLSLRPEEVTHVLCTLLKKAGRNAGKTSIAVLGAAMCAVEGEEMATELAGLLLHSPIGPLAVEYFRRFPALAASVLPKVASGTSKAADAARSILGASAPREDTPLAEGEEIPQLLRDAPWRKKKKSKPVVFATPPPMPATKIEWSAGERERVIETPDNWYARDAVEMTASHIQEWECLAKDRRPADVWVRWGSNRGNYRVPPALSLREWNENPLAVTYLGPLRMLALYGDAALPGLFARDAFGSSWNIDALFVAYLRAVGPESARVAAEAISRRKVWRKGAQQWIASHASVVAQSLLPTALSGEGRARKDAENAVRIAARAQREVVLDAARALGDDAARAAIELVERDPLTDLDVKGKLPPFVRIESLPPVKTRAGKRLPDDAVATLLEILRSTSPDSPYAGLDALRDALDETSLGELAWALVQAWLLAGAKRTFEWIPFTLALVGNDACARRLAPYVREWARKDATKVGLAITLLSTMGTSAALLQLSYIADKARFDLGRASAKEALERVASQHGLTVDELGDRTVPDLELDADGTTPLDFGPRKFTVTFDEGLQPVLKGEDGARLAVFPRGTKTDDAALVKAASARYKALKADAESVAQALLRRFERAMVRGRTWTTDAFRTYVLGHPLVSHVARRLVWSASSGPSFRVAEDGTLADQQDAEYTLPPGATVTLPHALVLGRDAVVAWSRVLGDYGVVQPFEQLARATHALEGTEGDVTVLMRFSGRKSNAGPLMGSLDGRGWAKWPDETSLSTCGKAVRTKSGGEASVSLNFSPGIDLGDVANSPEQVFSAPTLVGAPNFSAIDPIDFSELVRDLEALAH